jgi:hypothetical protein
VIVSFQLWKIAKGYIKEITDSILNVAVILNFIVVFFYWRLYFQDPLSVNMNGPNEWFMEYYLHALGPTLMVIDALFIHGSFNTFSKGLKFLFLLFSSYILWVEFIVAPYSSRPQGMVTKGFPYPFLNDLTIYGRTGFYLSVVFIGCTLYMALFFIKKYALPYMRQAKS